MFSYHKQKDEAPIENADDEIEDAHVEYHAGENPNYTTEPRKVRIPVVDVDVDLPELNMPAFTQATKTVAQRYLQPVLIGLLILVFIIIIVLAILVGVYSKQKSYPSLCVDTDCLRVVGDIKDYMDDSVSPCDNFYKYACGNYAKLNPKGQEEYAVTPLTKLQESIDDKLKNILEKAIFDGHWSHDAAKAKAEMFFESCIDDYERTSTSGATLARDILSLGSFYALQDAEHPWNDGNDWGGKGKSNEVMQRLHAEFGVDVFFKVGVNKDWGSNANEERYTITISPSEPAISFSDILNHPTGSDAEVRFNAYQELVTTVILHMWRDSNMFQTVDAPFIAQNIFNDIIKVETEMAKLVTAHPILHNDAHEPISALDDKHGEFIIWFEFLNEYFKNARLTRSTVIHIEDAEYIYKLIALLGSSDKLSIREKNNYIFWRMTYSYILELGWDYIYANRLFAHKKYEGNVLFLGTYNWCLRQVKLDLGYALSALFIDTHFGEVSQTQTQFIFDSMRKELVSRISQSTWMDASTQQNATVKLNGLLDKIGYPLWLLDDAELDAYYKDLITQHSDHYLNMVNLRKFQRVKMTDLLLQGVPDANEWPPYIFEAIAFYEGSANEMFLPAGYLQPPFFDYLLPGFVNFASMGRYVGRNMVNAIDYAYGRFHGPKGKFVDGGWYSDETLNNYNASGGPKDCANETLTRNANIDYNDTAKQAQLSVGKVMIWEFLRDAAALDASYQAYKDFANQYGAEAALPGLDNDSVDKDFFMIFAQTFCYNMDIDLIMEENEIFGVVPNDVLLNSIFDAMPTFQSTFGCKGNSKCPGY